MRRRTVLLGTGVTLAASVAGCANDAPAGGDEADADETDGGEDDADDGSDDGGEDDENSESDGSDETDDADGTDGEESESIEGLEILEHELVEEEFAVSVEGVLANNTGEELGTVELGVEFYDADGQRVDESTSRTADMADDEEWAFSMMTLEDGVTDYEIEITNAVPAQRSPL